MRECGECYVVKGFRERFLWIRGDLGLKGILSCSLLEGRTEENGVCCRRESLQDKSGCTRFSIVNCFPPFWAWPRGRRHIAEPRYQSWCHLLFLHVIGFFICLLFYPSRYLICCCSPWTVEHLGEHQREHFCRSIVFSYLKTIILPFILLNSY